MYEDVRVCEGVIEEVTGLIVPEENCECGE